MHLKLIVISICISLLCLSKVAQSEDLQGRSYVRYKFQGQAYYGVLSGQMITRLKGGLFPLPELSDDRVALRDVVLLPPSDPAKVFAVGMNFASHMPSDADAPPPLFLKLPSSLVGHGQDILVPSDAQSIHFEGELVIVIGKKAKNIKEEDAEDYIFGVTVGNDLTERSWQGSDLQWLRSKASDGFGPIGPAIVTGLDWNNLLLTTRLNGEVVQQETTGHMIHKPEKVVSYLSQYFTLEPEDIIFMGTPGRTSALASGDEVSVEIEGIGVLRNVIKWP